ncbi:hypothetical protein [Brochothrix thermosphacta]|uniref:Uncharacterized protein n=1 Tax=Brochothrix thermosphacta TaxID=2756 RepID=A0A2X0R451_BROTH|nr:hypothetical protein [Brochothrix thermosphacta]SPP28860.1 hypothetical protein BTBSAS_30178 [Brochothrix thermosphacta]
MTDLYAQALQRKKEKSGIDYAKLYSGTFEEKKIEKLKQENIRKKQKIATWCAEDDFNV